MYAWPFVTTTTFDYGNKQTNCSQIKATKKITFTVGGLKAEMQRLIDFFNAHQGGLKPFYFTYDGIKEVCYLQKDISISEKRENTRIIGYEAEITLDIDKQSSTYPSPSKDDLLDLLALGTIEESYNWNTTLYTTSSTQRRLEWIQPEHKIMVTFRGLKPDRDKLIRLYNSHGIVPLKFKHDGHSYSVSFPSSLEITDYREGQKIIGFECKCELEVEDEDK